MTNSSVSNPTTLGPDAVRCCESLAAAAGALVVGAARVAGGADSAFDAM